MKTKLIAIAGMIIALSLTACKKSETPAPNTTDKISCKNWKNALFVDGSELHYKIIHRRSGPKFENDPDYAPEYEFYATCHVKLKYATDNYCGSDLSCELDPEYNNQKYKDKYKDIIDHGLSIDAMWFMDKNAYYFISKEYFTFVQTPQKGECEHINYIKCEPGTLAWEYEPFNNTEPMIPLRPEIQFDEVKKEPTATIKSSLKRTGTLLCRHSDFSNEEGGKQ